MTRLLLRSSSFVRRAKKILKKHPHVSPDLQSALELLATNCFHPRLKTHKLKVNWKDPGRAAQATT